MTILDKMQKQNECVAIDTTPEDLRIIHCPACSATALQRDPLVSFQHWIDGLQSEQLPRARIILRPEAACDVPCDVPADVADAQGTPVFAERSFLIEGAAALEAIFATVMVSTYLMLRFDVINTNACRKFHIDAMTARLVCSYRGTGTRYGLSQDGQDPTQIPTVPTGSPVILRGTRWPETPASGLLYRSPLIVGTGETRLLLVLG